MLPKPSLQLRLAYAAAAVLLASPLAVSISSVASGPVARPPFSSVPRLLLGLGLWHGLLFLVFQDCCLVWACGTASFFVVFRDCCLTPTQKLRCSSHSPLLRQLFFWRRRWLFPSRARLGLWHGLFLKCSETAACSGPVARPPFLCVPKLLLDPLKSFAAAPTRLSSDNCSFGVAAGCLHLQRVWAYGTASFSSVPRLLLGLGLWHGLLFCSVPKLLLDPPQKLRCSSHSPLLRQLFFWRRR